MQERRDVYAYFWIQGYSVSHSDISARIGLAPTSTRSIGDKGQYGPPVKSNSWQLLSPLPRGEGLLQDYLESLLDVIEPSATAIRELSTICSAGINCVGYYYGSNPGLHLTPKLLARLAALHLPIDFDLYNYGVEDAA
jgi:Domain of unknown function (DUF4279)